MARERDAIARAVAELTPHELELLRHDWTLWARAKQLAPAGNWRVWLLLAGRGFGKTRSGAEWVRRQVESGAAHRIALVAPTAAAAREVMVEGESGLLAIGPSAARPRYEPSKRRLTWPNGAVATCYSAEEPERKRGPPLGLRLVAIKRPVGAAQAARRKARREAQRGSHQLSQGTLIAADWVILVTSLAREAFPTADVVALYRLRWRIELGFKRLKSLIGLRGPPGVDARSARPYLLAHLLIILLLEPLVDELEDSPRSAHAA